MQIPRDLNKFQASEESINFKLSVQWNQNENNVQRLILQNDIEKEKSIDWFYLTATENTAFLFPTQKSHVVTIDIIKDKNLMPAESQLITSWDTGTPALPLGQKKDVVTETAEELVPELQERSPQEILLDLVRNEENSFLFYIAALFIAVALGALHALTPGHGKTVVAAYLVGSRGTSFHAIVLDTVVTLTHTGSVFLLGMIAVVRRDLSAPRGEQIWLMNADGSDATMLTNEPDVLHASLNWSPDGKYLLYEIYALDVFPFESELRILEIESLEIQDLDVKGFNPMWVWK